MENDVQKIATTRVVVMRGMGIATDGKPPANMTAEEMGKVAGIAKAVTKEVEK